MKLNEATFFRVSSSMKANKQARAFFDEGNGRGPTFYVEGPNFTEEGAPPVPGALPSPNFRRRRRQPYALEATLPPAFVVEGAPCGVSST